MLVFLSMLAAGVLLLSTIVLLHKLQHRQKVDSVDRTIPLPPLDLNDKKRILAIVDSANAALQSTQALRPGRKGCLIEIVACDNGDGPALPDWLARSKFHAARNDHARALMNCARAFPLMGAFRQATTLLRGRIRELRKSGEAWERNLDLLYRIAVWADLLHGKWEGHLPPASAKYKTLDMLQLDGFDIDYTQLGYKHLALLGATDWKLLAECWGEPLKHQHARELYGDALQALLNQSGNH